MTARDRSERVGTREDGQPERQCDPGQADPDVRESGGQHGAAAAAEHEPESADEFGKTFFDQGIFSRHRKRDADSF